MYLKSLISLFALAFSFAVFANKHASHIVFSSKEKIPHLVELFTSEGCSSCPPADIWIEKQKHKKALFNSFIPVVYHVDYWNYIGWTDIFSDKIYSKKQHHYARLWGTHTVFTPSMVLGGEKWKGWRHSPDINKPNKKTKDSLLVRYDLKNKEYRIEFFTPKNYANQLQTHVVIMANGVRSHIKRGENAGKTLKHEFAVLDYKKIILKKVKNKYIAKLSLSPKVSIKNISYSIAAWITPKHGTHILQAAGGFLP